MKTATLLFGLAACTREPVPVAQYPLCDREGGPACGNIGQVGRGAPPPAQHAAQAPAQHAAPTPTAPLPASTAILQPLDDRMAVDTRPASERPTAAPERPAQTQPAPTRPAQTRPAQTRAPVAPRPSVARPAVHTRTLVGASQTNTTPSIVARPLQDHRKEVVCGNVMSKGGSRRVCRSADSASVVTADGFIEFDE